MAAALVCGLSIALFYEIYWLLVAWRPRPRWLAALQDLLLALAVFCIIAALWLHFTGGVMRLAVYLWLALGVLLFRATVSPSLRRLRRGKRPDAPPGPKREWRFFAAPAALMLKFGRGFWRLAARLAVMRQKNKQV